MSISMNSYISAYTNSAQAVSQNKASAKKETPDTTSKASQSDQQGVSLEISETGLKAAQQQESEVKGSGTQKGNPASQMADDIRGMSKEERSALVDQLKADQENFQNGFIAMVHDMFSEQINAFGESENIWKFLASGDYEVDAETQAEAQKNIAEDGYFGVKQTSERMFKFALALSGGNQGQMKKMQEAMQKGYDMAEETWGGELPEISQKTLDAANQLFEDYYNGNKKTETE